MRVGAPTKYKTEYVEMVRKLCLVGLIDEQLAMFFEIDVSTLNVWKNKYPEFKDSLVAAKNEFDCQNVERSLYSLTQGYSHPTVKVLSGKNLIGEITHKVVTHDDDGKLLMKHHPPNFNACRYWLNNRDPNRWRNSVNISAKITDELDELTDDELDEEIRRLESICTEECEVIE